MSFDKVGNAVGEDAKAALLSAIPAVFQALGMILIAGHSDRKQERRWHVACSAAMASVCLFLCGFCPNPLLSLACLSVTAFGIWGTVGPFWALPTSYLSASSAAAGIGLINSFGSLGGFSGTYLVGFIKSLSSDFIYSLAALAVSLMVAAGLTLAVRQAEET
jgi:MFS family permease